MFNKKNTLNYTLHLLNGLLPIILILFLNSKSSLTFMGYFFKALAVIGSVQIFVDYGFNFSGIKNYRELLIDVNPIQSRINFFTNLIFTKSFIGLIIFLGYLLYSKFILHSFIIADILYIFFGIIFSILNLNWFFYAIDKSLEFNWILILLRIISFFILFIIPLRLDNLLVINFAPYIFSNIILFIYLLYTKFPKDKLFYPKLELLKTLKSGWGIFSNGVIISFLTMSWPIFFARFISIEMIGLYGLADRISRGLRNLTGPLPFLILSKHAPSNNGFQFPSINKKYSILFGVILISVPLCFMLIPNFLLGIVLKGAVINYRLLLNLYSLGFIAGALNSLFYTYLIMFSKERLYLIYFVISYFVGILLGLIIGTYLFMPLFVEFTLCFFLLIKFLIEFKKIKVIN